MLPTNIICKQDILNHVYFSQKINVELVFKLIVVFQYVKDVLDKATKLNFEISCTCFNNKFHI